MIAASIPQKPLIFAERPDPMRCLSSLLMKPSEELQAKEYKALREFDHR
jgi:hypothetical protein